MKKTARAYAMTSRLAKAAATKARIRECAARLYAEKALDRLTLDEVAECAEVTVQTILRVFKSKENLFVEAMSTSDFPQRLIEPHGDIAASVAAIFDLYEATGDHILRRLSDEERFAALRGSVELGRRRHREWTRIVFAPQLGRFRGAVRRRIFKGLVAATDVYSWKILRRDEALSRREAESVIRLMIEGLVSFREGKIDKGD
jgi:AcrR family transcriptional regulator